MNRFQTSWFHGPAGSCTRMKRLVFSQLHFLKELCVNSKPKPRRATYDPHRFTVREYCLEQEEQKLQEMKQLSVHKKEQYGIFVRWLKVNLSQVFVAWIHLKALRVFVESVLRYGLPVNFQALLLQTEKKHSKKLREELASLFVHLDPTATTSKSEVGCDIPGLCQHEYFSYISFHINTNVLELS